MGLDGPAELRVRSGQQASGGRPTRHKTEVETVASTAGHRVTTPRSSELCKRSPRSSACTDPPWVSCPHREDDSITRHLGDARPVPVLSLSLGLLGRGCVSLCLLPWGRTLSGIVCRKSACRLGCFVFRLADITEEGTTALCGFSRRRKSLPLCTGPAPGRGEIHAAPWSGQATLSFTHFREFLLTCTSSFFAFSKRVSSFELDPLGAQMLKLRVLMTEGCPNLN